MLQAAARVAVTSRCARGIDERGLHVTNLAALRDCLERVAVPGTVCLTDGFPVRGLDHPNEAVIDGDARSAAIAAASVIAKVTRDRYMKRAAEELPRWHFHTNVGYSTPEHREAILIHGVSSLHRRSFQSVAYQQLPFGESECAGDVVELKDLAAPGQEHPDGIEADVSEAGQVPGGAALGEP